MTAPCCARSTSSGATASAGRLTAAVSIRGTSAGASALSAHMVAFGGPGEVPKQRLAQLSAGLGLLPGAVIDQHFSQRNRLGRLLLLVAESPSQLGIGVDEDTAAVIQPDGVLEVLGKGTVTIVDGSRAESDAFEVRARRPVLVSGVVLAIVSAAAWAYKLSPSTGWPKCCK